MTPSFTQNSLPDCALGNAILNGECFLANVAKGISAAYLRYRRFIELCAWSLATSALTGLTDHIGAVVGRSTKKEMIGAHTAWIVTMVADAQAFGNWAVLQFPCKAMRKYRLIVSDYTAAPLFVFRSSPYPAARRGAFINSIPKAGDSLTPAVMSFNKVAGLPDDMTAPFVGVFSNRGRLTAATFTEFNGRVLRGMIGVHDDLLCRCVKPWGVSAPPGQLLAYLHYTPFRQSTQGEVIA